ncbi:hypothetical protein VP01_181g2 [Puccinia sorghi]|uniref:Uncharacterized protein n=1 Tax=Puccinia sorghi TaxID=27349 RepID=A0A0L6VDZ8_9BASI|nr:hypothetical protein VP01_181g2 [Puccinia sorghi]
MQPAGFLLLASNGSQVLSPFLVGTSQAPQRLVLRGFRVFDIFFTDGQRFFVALGFPFPVTDSTHCVLAPSKNWNNSLVINNTRCQGVVDTYADLDGVEFIHFRLLLKG